MEQLSEYTQIYPKHGWEKVQLIFFSYACMCIFINLVPFIQILSYRHSKTECMVQLYRIRRQYGLA